MPVIPRYPGDVWVAEALLDPNTLERNCVHLQNGDSSIDTHANVWQLYLAHCDSRVVLL
jgi:hypothetical protein